MARTFSLIAFGLLFSLHSTSAIRTKVPGDDPTASDASLAVASSTGDRACGLLEANCERLTFRGGFKLGDTLKVTASGWGKSNADFLLELATDNSGRMAQLRSSAPEVGPGLAGGDSQQSAGPEESKSEADGDLKEQPSIPVLGVRIPGSDSADGKARQPVVLVYGDGEEAPTEFPLDSPAGPTSPFMVILTRSSSTEVAVRLLTWVSEGDGTGGSWHEADITVGARMVHYDLKVNVGDCGPRSLRIYGSAHSDLVTADGSTCKAADPMLVSLQSPPQEPHSVPGASSEA
ncbi:Microneme protein etmic-2/7h, related [Eimeria brunetti]|uniref:Microneme protein etmic-2/7h, related n=1 Tax=Eimeria brunetti TaxID=51314 RepID=U6LN16_9EIME|nr:Microneme protein etmic-2/7h, related [Eimeria brunetti]